MNQINNKEALETLHKQGFTDQEIKQLIQLRRKYIAGQPKQTPHRHPIRRFASWLARVILTNEVVEALAHQNYADK